MRSYTIVYITTKDLRQARLIGKTLVCEKLAACANILDRMHSFYFWDGKLCDDREAVLLVKTKKALLDRLVKRVKELHTYAIPCIAAFPIVGGNSDFLAWVGKETTGPQKRKK